MSETNEKKPILNSVFTFVIAPLLLSWLSVVVFNQVFNIELKYLNILILIVSIQFALVVLIKTIKISLEKHKE